jgi:phosphoribosylformylglycinamidine synthase
MWQFAEAVRGLADGCAELEVPVTGGNVSFYNQTGEVAILPTPVVGVLGVISDVSARVPMAFAREGDVILLLGDTRDEIDGSEWAHVVHGHLGGTPPMVDLEAERSLGAVLVEGAESGLFASAHDLSEGGLAQGLVECCLRGGLGARVELPARLDAFVALFSESAARAIVSVAAAERAAVTALAELHGVTVAHLGTVGGSSLRINADIEIPLTELREAHTATLPAAMA